MVRNAFWSPGRRRQARYAVDGLCEHCGQDDTVLHRWQCPGFRECREGIDKEVIDYVVQQGSEVLASRAIAAKPKRFVFNPSIG